MKRILILALLVPSLYGQEADTLGQQMVGILSATFLYQSYLNIGFLADLHAGGQYDEETALGHGETLVAVIAGARDELQAYRRYQVSEVDQQYIAELIKVVDVLLQECIALNEYMETGDPRAADRFNEMNELAQQAISQLLGLEDLE